MKLKLFLCVLCLALFAEGIFPQTASDDQAARLIQVEGTLKQQGEDIRSMENQLTRVERGVNGQLMWFVGIVFAIFIAGYALVHQMRTQFSDFMAKLLDMHLQLANTIADLQVEMGQLRTHVDMRITNLQGEMNAKFAEVHTDVTDLRGDVSDVKSDLRGDISDVKIDVGDVKKDVAIIQKDVVGIQNNVAGIQNDVDALTEKVDGIDAHVGEVERNTSAQLNDIRETLAKQQEINSDTTKQEPNVGPPTEE